MRINYTCYLLVVHYTFPALYVMLLLVLNHIRILHCFKILIVPIRSYYVARICVWMYIYSYTCNSRKGAMYKRYTYVCYVSLIFIYNIPLINVYNICIPPTTICSVQCITLIMICYTLVCFLFYKIIL